VGGDEVGIPEVALLDQERVEESGVAAEGLIWSSNEGRTNCCHCARDGAWQRIHQSRSTSAWCIVVAAVRSLESPSSRHEEENKKKVMIRPCY
jgi:hypothetical protein